MINARHRQTFGLSVAVAAAGISVAMLLPAGCGTARREEAIAGPLHLSDADPADAAALRGQRAFMANCHQCHPGGAAGLGPGLNDKPLPGFAIKAQVRNGVGAMPAFSPDEIDDGTIDDLVVYLVALRRNDAAGG